MAEARVTLDFLAGMLDLPEGVSILHVESVMEGDETYAQLRLDAPGHGLVERVQLTYAEDELGMPALVSIDPV
jgi:hypothetical protein